jgi:sugar phosphate isomerase/epimerase
VKVSIVSYSFHGLLQQGKLDVFGYLESCRYRYGLDAADIWNGMLTSTAEDYLKKVREAMDEKELLLANLCVDGAHLWEDDTAAREKNYQTALQYLKAAEILGAKTLRIDMGGKGERFTDEQVDYIVSRYQEYCRRAHDGGFRVGPETHWGPELTLSEMKRVTEAVNHPAYGILLHIGHWNGGPAAEALGDRTAAAWAVHTHVDARITQTCLEERLRLLLDAGYQGYWGVEHHSGINEYSETAWQLAAVRRALIRIHTGVKEK